MCFIAMLEVLWAHFTYLYTHYFPVLIKYNIYVSYLVSAK